MKMLALYRDGTNMTRPRGRKTDTGLTIRRYFTGSGKGAVPAIAWVNRSATVHTPDGGTAGVSLCEAPADWSKLAVDMAVTRYFAQGPALVQPKTSIRALVERVTQAITDGGRELGIFRATRDSGNYQAELARACLGRYGWFSASVWRSVGIARPRNARRAPQAINAAAENASTSKKPYYLPIHAPDTLVRDRRQLKIIAQKVHECGAATIHFDDTIAAWHTCPASGPVVGATPSDGYLFLDDSGCNVATININRFLDNEGRLDLDALQHTVTLFTIALDILVDGSDYADRNMTRISRAHRTIGLSSAGLAPLLMRLAMPYDSDSGRAYAAALTSFITATACATSQRLAVATQPFSAYAANQTSVLAVIHQHRAAAATIGASPSAKVLRATAQKAWERIIKTAPTTGFRNAHVTLLAAAGKAGLILDCDASDLGPMMSLVKYIRTANGHIEQQVNPCVEQALTALGYTAAARSVILAHILKKETIEGAPGLKRKHLPVFDCECPSRRGGFRSLSVEAQMKMMAAVQPSLSGCTQRPLTLPQSVGVDQLAKFSKDAWKLGMRTIDLHRSSEGR